MRRRFILAISVLLGMGALYGFWWLALRPPDADEVARAAAQALTKNDVQRLLNLTSPEEKQRLNLTAGNVQAVLNDSLYARGPIGRLAIRQVSDYPVDEPTYLLIPMDRHDLPGQLNICINEMPNGRWYLPLGYTLLVAYGASRQSQDVRERRREFYKEVTRQGIRGIRLNTTGYEYFGSRPGI